MRMRLCVCKLDSLQLFVLRHNKVTVFVAEMVQLDGPKMKILLGLKSKQDFGDRECYLILAI